MENLGNDRVEDGEAAIPAFGVLTAHGWEQRLYDGAPAVPSAVDPGGVIDGRYGYAYVDGGLVIGAEPLPHPVEAGPQDWMGPRFTDEPSRQG